MIRRTLTPEIVSPDRWSSSPGSPGLGKSLGSLVLMGLVCLIPACGAGESGGSGTSGSGTDAVDTGRTERGEVVSRPGSDLDSVAGPRVQAEPGPGAEPGPETPSPTTTELPEGGLDDWVEQMRDRLEVIELDPRNSYPDVLSLYNSHHGAMERYYGAGGRVTRDAHPDLAAAVQRQDSAFHELLELTGTTDYIERTHLLHAIRNVRLAMEEILDRARAAGVPLDPSS